MKQILKKAIIAITALGLAAALFAWLYDVGHHMLVSGNEVISGNTPPVLYQAKYVDHANPQQTMQVVVGLKLRNETELDQLIAEQSNRSSPQFRHYITPSEFVQRFGPSAADVDSAVSYFKGQGLNVVSISSNRVVIVLEGTTSQFEQTFGVHLNEYHLQGVAGFPDGTYLSNDHDPIVPSSLASIVESVSGLNTFAQYQSHVAHGPSQPAQSSPSGYSPQDIAQAYGYPNQNNPAATGTKYSGAGRTIAIATAYGYTPSDVNTFWKQFGITRTGTITNIPVNGTTKKTDDETTLDLETIGAQAPGAGVLMYIGANSQFTTFTLIFNQIVTDDRADVVSVSWGSCESGTGMAQMRTESSIFKQGAAQGIAFFASSGDDGAYDCGGKKPHYAVDYPSADPNVTAVGGTSLFFWHDRRVGESAWSGSGGGVSQAFPQPYWQQFPSEKMRNTADVSMNADPWTGYAIYFNGSWIGLGGTSVSAPNWAALWLLTTQATGQRLGPANPTIYRIAGSADYSKVFLDITSGDNGAGKGPGFKSGSGYDHPTGWGVPNATALVDWIVNDSKPPAQAPSTGTQAPATPSQPPAVNRQSDSP